MIFDLLIYTIFILFSININIYFYLLNKSDNVVFKKLRSYNLNPNLFLKMYEKFLSLGGIFFIFLGFFGILKAIWW